MVARAPREAERGVRGFGPRPRGVPSSGDRVLEMGREVVVAITTGALDFGPWEQIFYAEFDGRRRKRVLVKVIGE